jgi:hypothetical protein
MNLEDLDGAAGDMDPGQGRKTTHFFSSQYLELIHIASMN